MGAYSPAPIVDERIHKKIIDEVMKPTMQGLISEGSPYLGFLYAGIMISKGELKVLEFNCRFGDLETQPILLRLKSSLVQLCLAAIDDQTAAVSIGQVHWVNGTKYDLTSIRQKTRAVGAALIIDGTQSIGALPFDVQEVQPDALVVAGYKWLMGPYSIGMA